MYKVKGIRWENMGNKKVQEGEKKIRWIAVTVDNWPSVT